MGERLYWLSFSAFPGVGPVRFRGLLKRFGTAKSAWKVLREDLQEALGEKTGEKFDRFRREFSIEGYVNKLKEKEVRFLTLTDEDYPELLKKIPNPPFILYFKGALRSPRQLGEKASVGTSSTLPTKLPRLPSGSNMWSSRSSKSPPSLNDNRTVAVVGTRKVTNYGREVTRMLVSELVANGFTIVSGLALGIDAVAHEVAIEGGGRTMAVLGNGVDVCYPRANQSLYDRIVTGSGLVISEFPLGQTPSRGSFPSRNRIIAGLSLGVLVTEGAEDSGALITADYAFKFNRKVFAVPGSITSGLSKGPHKLIEKGAKLVTSSEDIIKELGVQGKGLKPPSSARGGLRRAKGDNKEEEMILKILENEDLHIDEIIRRSGFNTAKIGSLLSLMEVKGMVQGLGGGVFGISR